MSDCDWECTSNTSGCSAKGDEAFAKKKAGLHKGELNCQLIEYINEWRKTREKEEEELRNLKEKQAKRKEIRAEQERILNQQKKDDEDKLRKEEAVKKAAEADEKKKRLEEAETKRQQMMETQKAKSKDGKAKKSAEASGHMSDARREISKTREQLEEEKNIALAIRIKPLDLESMDSDDLKAKATELFKIVVQMETDKYDFEQRSITQDYELMELKERQKVQLRQKAVKKGLDPEALVGRHPPKVRMYSKYERRTDTRTYEDRKTLYEGGWEVIRSEILDSMWTDKYEEWSKRPSRRLPIWFGERPGKKFGDAETPEGDDGGNNGVEAEDVEDDEEDYDEEEEDNYEEEEE